jgi:phosphoribosylamine--glycine ligase
VVVVIASDGYPGAVRLGDPVEGAFASGVIHSGTSIVDGVLVSAGGRVVGCTGIGPDLASAREKAYALVDQVALEGAHHRRDIALAAVEGRITLG